jgi:hypothetical protein
MKKIRLDADALEVLSFTTEQMPEVRGTVEAAGTGNPCYVTVAVYQTRCMAYPVSYWNENTCYCPMEPATEAIECRQITDFTCPGWPGC